MSEQEPVRIPEDVFEELESAFRYARVEVCTGSPKALLYPHGTEHALVLVA